MRNKVSLFFLSIALFSFSFIHGHVLADTKPISEGTLFPKLVFNDSLSKKQRAYLGLSQKTVYSIKDFKGTVFIIEVFSTYCTSCPKNVPVLNSISSSIENNATLKGTVKVFGIAIGNNRNEVKSFVKEHYTSYPIFTDYHFTAHKAMGNPRVPYTIIVTREPKGTHNVGYTHQSTLESEDTLMNVLRNFVKCN